MKEGVGLLPDASLAMRGWVFGTLVSCFCLGQFFAGPILGALSDRKGRKRVLLATLLIALGGYLFAVASLWTQNIALFFIARLLSGIGAGNFAIAQSIMVDYSSEGEKAKNFGLIGMAWGAGFILGPYFGGQMIESQLLGMSAPFWFASLLCLINVIWLQFALKETLPAVQFRKISLLAGIEDLKKAFSHPTLRGLFCVMFIFAFGWGFFTEFSPLFLMGRFHFDAGKIGLFYAWVGIFVALSQGVFIRPFLKRFSSVFLLKCSLAGLGIAMLGFLFIEKTLYLFLFLPVIALFEAFIYPTATTLVSDLTPKESQGEILGLNNSIQWAAIGITPLFSGSFVALYPHLPITVASGGMLLAFLLFLWVWKAKGVKANSA